MTRKALKRAVGSGRLARLAQAAAAWTVLHLFAGIGGGALGFQRAGFETVGAVDNDAGACRDFEMLVGRPCTCADIETMTPAELAAACTKRPDVVFTSPPCKGFSRCQSAKKAQTEKYQRMNALTLRGIWLALEAWDVPPPLILMENVPAILSRGREWLEKIEALLRAYGYAVSRSTHDCGELGGLAQHRRRFLLVARHMEQVPAYLRVPVRKRVRGIGEVLAALPCPVPGSTEGGPMHKLTELSALNWVRLALIPAGKDWRALPKRVRLTERAARQNGGFGVGDWTAPSHGVLGHHEVRSTWGSVADPRVRCKRREGGHGVKAWDEPSTAVIGRPIIDNFPGQVADPRLPPIDARHAGTIGVEPWDEPSHTVTGQHGRRGWDSVADPRVVEAEVEVTCNPHPGMLGVRGWAEPSHTVRAHFNTNNAPSAVADPRVPVIEGPRLDLKSKRKTYIVIRAADGTWHRPLTTLELAALQSFPTKLADGSWLVLGGSKRTQREHIGNAVPPDAAEAIALQCKATLIAARDGSFELSSAEIWVRRQEVSHAA